MEKNALTPWGYIAPHLTDLHPGNPSENTFSIEGEGGPTQKYKGKISWEFEGNRVKVHASIVSESDSLIGPVFRIPFEFGRDSLSFTTRDHCYTEGKSLPVPEEWKKSLSGAVTLKDFSDEFAFGIRPPFHPLQGTLFFPHQGITLSYRSHSEESSFYLFREKGAPWIGVAPLSSQNPWKPNLTVSSIEATVLLGI